MTGHVPIGAVSDLITIGIPTYRRPTALLHCLHGCFIQDYRPLEIDISDNSPTDETRSLVESLLPPSNVSIRYWRNEPSLDPVDNHRKLLNSARGTRFVWMNDDDVLLPGAVKALAGAFSLAPDVILAYGMAQVINAAGEHLPDRTVAGNAERARSSLNGGLRRDLLVCALSLHIPNIGFLVQTETARRVDLRSRSEVGLAIDTDFAIRLARVSNGSAFVFLDRMIYQSRVHRSSLAQTELDVNWKLYQIVADLDDLSSEEERARDLLLERFARQSLRENALGHRRRAAVQILLSPGFLRANGTLPNIAYSLLLILAPRFASRSASLFRMLRNGSGLWDGADVEARSIEKRPDRNIMTS
jgi:glycosyltransferase involved in cell wall biosynthesis